MSPAKRRLRTATQLQGIEKARRSAAERDLAEARAAASRAELRHDEAAGALARAAGEWSDRLQSGRLDLELQRQYAAGLLGCERDLDQRDLERSEADGKLDTCRASWIELEAGVRSGDLLLKRWRREEMRRTAARADQALSDRASWAWFKP